MMSAYSDLAIFNAAGFCIGATDPDWENLRASKESFFTGGLKQYHFGQIYDSPDEGKVQLVSTPISSGGDVLGVLVGELKLSALYDLMDQKLGVGDEAEVFLLDANLRFITPGRGARGA